MENFKVIIYSIIQGITEFLPVSSSAHLYLAQELFNWQENMILMALGAHLGTLLAVMLYQKKNFYFKEIKQNKIKLLVSVLISSFPVIFLGFILTLFLKGNYKNDLLIIALASIIGGLLLEVSDNINFKKEKSSSITYKQALLVGLFQMLALIPGMSRSGSIITAMRFINKERIFCINFSLLTSIPVLILACSYGLYELVFNYNFYAIKFFTIVIVSFMVALLSINFFIVWTKKFSFRIFSIYRIFLGLLILSYLYIN